MKTESSHDAGLQLCNWRFKMAPEAIMSVDTVPSKHTFTLVTRLMPEASREIFFVE